MRIPCALVLLAMLSVACGGDRSSAVAPEPGTLEDGYHRITVVQPDGEDAIWIYAASPDGEGPLPLVVYGHGQGTGDFVNCQPGAAEDAMYPDTAARADALASLGYLAVAIEYRNGGDGAPVLGEVKLRDHDVYDARTFLAAAAWAAHEHRRGSSEVAFVGTSMGTWPSFWAATTRTELADLQEGLDIRTIVLAAESANHVANVRQDPDELCASQPCPASNLDHAKAVIGPAFMALGTSVAELELPSFGEADLEPGTTLGDLLAERLTPDGVELVRLGVLRDGSTEACQSGVPALCSETCMVSSISVEMLAGETDMGPAGDWLAPQTIDAVSYWSPPQAIDPGADADNQLLAALRTLSPAYSATGLRTTRAMSLLSAFDAHYDADARALLIARLEALGATVAHPELLDPSCGHQDYLVEAKPCGFAELAGELASAFAN